MNLIQYISMFVFMIFLTQVAASCTLISDKVKNAIWYFVILMFLVLEMWQIGGFIMSVIKYYKG